jgi:poly(ADP-ribose) glycohydrolase
MEEVNDALIVDFANASIGGGTMQMGCAQEEMLFVSHPECIPAMLLVPGTMGDIDTISIRNVRKVSDYKGYSSTFTWLPLPNDSAPLTETWKEFVATDAVPFVLDYEEQFSERYILRELNKAYCGFSSQSKAKDIATGNWGCGAFCGDLQLKSIIQWIAASEAKRQNLIYFCFEKTDHGDKFMELVPLLEKKTVGDLFAMLNNYARFRNEHSSVDLFQFIQQ